MEPASELKHVEALGCGKISRVTLSDKTGLSPPCLDFTSCLGIALRGNALDQSDEEVGNLR